MIDKTDPIPVTAESISHLQDLGGYPVRISLDEAQEFLHLIPAKVTHSNGPYLKQDVICADGGEIKTCNT